MPTVTATALPPAAPVPESAVAETVTPLPVVMLLPMMFTTLPLIWLLLKLARLAPVAPAAPSAETFRMLPVKDLARMFTAPIEPPVIASVVPE